MRKRLEAIPDLPALAKECHYHPGELAARLGVSLRTLERFFKEHYHQSPEAPISIS